MPGVRIVATIVLACLFAAGWSGTVRPAVAAGAGRPPLSGPLITGFDPPAVPWGAGHRGVDLAGSPGDPVVAPADGVVTFSGAVAGRPVVVVSHGEVRSTLEPVQASVAVGTRVAAGDTIGVLVAGHACPAVACLHWGLKRGEEYLDPWSLVTGDEVRLLPDGAADGVRERAAARERAARSGAGEGAAAGGAGVLARPAAGAVTSVFGMRLHPIFREWRMHQGIDLSAPCGSPIRAAADGVVTHVGYDASGGWRLVIAHGRVAHAGRDAGVDLQTVYLHAQGYRVRAGDRVARGEQVGTVGSTGWSTGCHLHFGVKAGGRHVDPQRWLG